MAKIINLQNTEIIYLYPGKSYKLPDGYRFSFDTSEFDSNLEFGLAVFDKKTDKLLEKIPFTENMRFGRVYSAFSPDYDAEHYSYCFYAGDKLVMDERAEKYCGKTNVFGDFQKNYPLKADFLDVFDWMGDKKLSISYSDAFIYLLHVRGFTKHNSSGTKYKGTFKGVEDKIEYLKGLGVTTIELQPAYEFNECDKKTARLNYWGYTKGYYYAPKAAYSYSNDAGTEFASLVKKLHENNLEIIMQFYFPSDFSKNEIVPILEFWAQKYHVDGFHVFGENISLDCIDSSAILANAKIFADNLDCVKDKNKKYALYRDDYLYSLRRFLKGDENTLQDALFRMKMNPNPFGVINYLDSYNTFTLNDMVCYDFKHNEDNGENNLDGNNFNCSWNCGEEGNTRKQKVLKLRSKQLENALLLLFLSCGAPMIFMGDEFGNSQSGNNNPYCQDNAITWLDWKGLTKKSSLYDFISNLSKLRRDKVFLHSSEELSLVDVSGCGFPEISYHGESAWKTQVEGYRHNVGILYSEHNDLLYAAINMHWDEQKLSLPRPPKGYAWKMLLSTDNEIQLDDEILKVNVPARTIALFITEKIK